MKKGYIIKKNLMLKESDNMFFFETDLFFVEFSYCSFLDIFLPEHRYSQPMHSHHTNYELYMVLRGSCNIETNDNKKFVVEEGKFILIPPSIKHRITYESNDFLKITLRFNLVAKVTDKPNLYQTAEDVAKDINVLPYNKQMRDLISLITKNANETPHEYKTAIFIHAISFVIEVLRVVVEKTKIKSNKKYKDARITTAVEYIKNNISATLTTADVAQHLHISTKQFTRIFTKELGVTPGNYIRNFRIERIRELLTTTNLQLQDIVDIMDYSDTTSLIRAFKRMEGNTPIKYKTSINE